MRDTFAVLEENKTTQSANQPNIWRIIMKSRITKFAVAAVIIVAVLIGINQFGGSIDGANIAFAQIAENMEQMPWMHAVVEGAGERLEAWISFERKVMVEKRTPGGEIRYHDGLKQTVQVFDPDTNTITISYTSNKGLAGVGNSVLDFPKQVLKLFDESGGKIIQKTGKYKGKDSKIYSMSGFLGGMDMKIEMIVEIDKNILLFVNQKALNKDGTVKMEANAYFDYPEDGPVDIYDVGVPKSAKVINNLPAEDVPKIFEQYRSHRESAPSRYVAIVINSWFDKEIGNFLTYGASIIYRDGKVQRVDDFQMPRTRKKEWRKIKLELEKEMGSAFESQLSWWQKNGQLSAVNLYDGKYHYQLERQNEKWTAEPKRYLPLGDGRGDDDLADFGWSVHFVLPWSGDEPFNIIEDEYSKKNNLIVLASVSQGRIMSDNKQTTWAIAPKRVLCYLNPERDYICQRFERHELFDAPWQKDKAWFDRIEQDKFKKQWATNEIREIVEFEQTEDGRWYPKTIKTWDPTDADDGGRIKKIWLRSTPEFPDGIFNPENLPR